MNRFWPLGEPIIKFDTLPLLLASPFVEHEAEPSLGRSEPVVSRNSLRFCYSNRYAPLERLRCKSVGHVRQAGPNASIGALDRFWPPGRGLASLAHMQLLAPAHPAYNARVDRLDAIRLLQALVAAGANTRAPMASAWVDEIAVRDIELHGTALASAIAYAEGQTLARPRPNKRRLDLPHSPGSARRQGKCDLNCA